MSQLSSREATRRVVPAAEQLEYRCLLAAASPTSGVGPTVLSVLRYGFHKQPTVLVLQFSQQLSPVQAENPVNYVIRSHKSRNVNVGSAVYDPATQSVTLTLKQRLNIHVPNQLLVRGTAPTGLANTSGVLLNGANTAAPGSNYSTFINSAILAGPSPPPVGSAAVVDAALCIGIRAIRSSNAETIDREGR